MQNRKDLTRLKRELHDFLIKKQISLETNIFNDFIYKKSGIKLADTGENHSFNKGGFDLFPYNNEEQIKFNVPNLEFPEFMKLLEFFNFPASKYVTNTALTLPPQVVFASLVPQFKAYVNEMTHDEINKYQIESKTKLEASAITTLKKYTEEALDLLTPKYKPEASPLTWEIADFLDSLQNKVNKVMRKPTIYQRLIECSARIQNDFLQNLEVISNQALVKQLKLIVEGIAQFAEYHRCESILANQLFLKEMRHFLKDDKYKIAPSQCHVIEDTLLRLAGAKLGKQADCSVNVGQDSARLVFTFTDINKENTEKVINFLRAQGDETVLEGYGRRTYGHAIPESLMCMSVEKSSSKRFRTTAATNDYVESHSVETDGKFFYEKMMPMLQNEIAAMKNTDPGILKNYEGMSENYFKIKATEKAAKLAKNSIFTHTPTPPIDEPFVQDNNLSMQLG